jgi:mannosyltransferase OCH1-like enzyme
MALYPSEKGLPVQNSPHETLRPSRRRAWGKALLVSFLLLLTILNGPSAFTKISSKVNKCTHQSPTSIPHISINKTIGPTTTPHGWAARQLAPDDLIRRALLNSHGAIPRLFHRQSPSKQLPVPGTYERFDSSCRDLHRDWEWVVWTPEDDVRLVDIYFPWFLKTFRSLTPAERTDTTRNMYMFLFGG